MKSFFTTLVLTILTLIGIAINNSYINNVGIQLEKELNALPAPSDSQCIHTVNAIQAKWETERKLVHISVNHNIVDKISEQFALLSICAVHQDYDGFYTSKALLIDAIGDMRRLEQLGAVL